MGSYESEFSDIVKTLNRHRVDCPIRLFFTDSPEIRAAVKTTINGARVKVIHIDHLIKNKSAMNRPTDRLDVEELKKRRASRK